MKTEHLLKQPLWQLTGEEFLNLLNDYSIGEAAEPEKETPKRKNLPRYVYGIRGIANLLDCSISTANRIKKKGILDNAIIQQGRTIMVDVDRALELLKENSEL